jgi:lipoprotein-anchoring transpeptidase ErfK/SrfK
VTKQLQEDQPPRQGQGDVRRARLAMRTLAVLAAMSTPVMAREAVIPDANGAALVTIGDSESSVSPLDGAPALVKTLDLSGYAPGTIVVQTSERKLHLVLAGGEVRSYPVGVGKAGKSWSGVGYIRGKFIRPAWAPPKALKREKPNTPDYIPGGVSANPMGAAAMTLSVDQYAIHGTNNPSSIGTFASFGCIRMHNRDVLDLYKRVKVGTKVVVLK